MARYQLTNKAEADIDGIYEYSVVNFGLRTTRDYLSGMHDCFDMLAENPSWGNVYGFIEPDLCRYEYRSHSVYYRKTKTGILVVRVLGNRQDPARHF